MIAADVIFYVLSIFTVISGLGVILTANPIYSALSLAITMTLIAALFFTMGAYFIAGMQLIVYAGAVVVLFVIVLMLFDLGRPGATFSVTKLTLGLKIGVIGACFVIIGVPLMSQIKSFGAPEATQITTETLAMDLFSKYVFAFETIGILLLVVLVGAVTLAKSRGGTHE